ncbi:hypothetical protein M0R72_21820, partial [Candidatus Pacearchaeota archaeon]|nr:hypothetical protein [Candidatus Pacearchaeota archaeon]
MKRTITGWVAKRFAEFPFWQDGNGRLCTAASKTKKQIESSDWSKPVRVKITVETVAKKAKTAKLAKCGECGANAVVESYVGLDGKWFYCECSKCTMDVL